MGFLAVKWSTKDKKGTKLADIRAANFEKIIFLYANPQILFSYAVDYTLHCEL